MKTSNILVALDLSDFSKKIINFSLTFAQGKSSRLSFIHVISNDISYPIESPDFQYISKITNNFIKSSKEQLEKATDFIKEKDVPYEINVVEGIPYREILEKAKEIDAQMIIIGSHGHGILYETLVGSVASAVLKKASIPVLIVPDKYYE